MPTGVKVFNLAFSRCEDGGLRCPFHGWLYDVSGALKTIDVRLHDRAEDWQSRLGPSHLGSSGDLEMVYAKGADTSAAGMDGHAVRKVLGDSRACKNHGKCRGEGQLLHWTPCLMDGDR